MKNIKKIGVTALAGSLAMFSVAQADMSVSGGAEFTYTSTEGTGGASSASSTGNPFGMEHSITFSGSGELDNGFTYNVMTNIAGQDTNVDSSMLSIDMGDMGMIGFDQAVGAFGMASVENNVPTAYEEADHNVGSLAHGINVAGSTGVIGYKGSFYGIGVNVSYNPTAGETLLTQAGSSGGTSDGSETAAVLTAAVPYVDGLTAMIGASKTDYSLATANDDTEVTGSLNYAVGPVAVGYQYSETQQGANDYGNNITSYGIAFNVNENLSISYNQTDNEKDNGPGVNSGVNVTEENTGINAAYTMGSASIRVAINEADGVNGVAADTKEATEISLALAF